MPQALINIHSFLQDFNPTKFTVYFSTLLFSILLTLRLDRKISVSYWLVFLPLWIWKFLAILGAYVGILVWLRNPAYRVSNSSYVHFKSMLISTSLQILLLMSEVIICDNLETRRNSWNLAFVPLLFICLLSIPICFWSLRHGRGMELEFFAALNFLQILFIALKLDFQLNMSWLVVFLPTWVLLSFSLIIILYVSIVAAMIARSPELGGEGAAERHRANFRSVPTLSMIFVPLCLFAILLTNKLDAPPNMPTPGYFATSIPLFVTLLILTHSSFGSKPGSLWWFGMRTDFCTFLLNQCPCLKEFGNTSFTMTSSSNYSNSVRPNDLEQNDQPNIVHTNDDGLMENESLESFSDENQRATGGICNMVRSWLHFNKTNQDNQNNNELPPNNNSKDAILKLAIDTPD